MTRDLNVEYFPLRDSDFFFLSIFFSLNKEF